MLSPFPKWQHGGDGLGCEACTIIQCENPGIRRDVLTAVTLVCWAPTGCDLPEREGSPSTILQHQALQTLHTGQRWLFTAWVQLLVFKDTVALFRYQHGLWGHFFFFRKTATKTNPFSPVFTGLSTWWKRLLRASQLQLHHEVLPREPWHHVTW